MRILKYLFLLLLLFFIAITVYITTQKGDFEVTETSFIKARKSIVYDYINDFKNWESFASWNKKENTVSYDYAPKTIGAGGSFSWKINSDTGNCKTVFSRENDSIAQFVNYNGSNALLHWKFKDSANGTLVTVRAKGKMDIVTKSKSFFKGGISLLISDVFKKSLHNLNKTLDYELKTYSVKVNGVVQCPEGFYLKKSVSCTRDNIIRNIKVIMPKLLHFFKKNKMAITGRPFVIYNDSNLLKDTITLSVCMPVEKELFLMPGSDISFGQMEGFTCLKTTLTGDYSHRAELWKTARKYISDNNYNENLSGKYIEVYIKTIDEVKKPSKWVTELYIPVFPKSVPAPVQSPVSETSPVREMPKPVVMPEKPAVVKPEKTVPEPVKVTSPVRQMPKPIVRPATPEVVKPQKAVPGPIRVPSPVRETPKTTVQPTKPAAVKPEKQVPNPVKELQKQQAGPEKPPVVKPEKTESAPIDTP